MRDENWEIVAVARVRWVCQEKLCSKVEEQNDRSIAEKVPYVEFIWVGIPFLLRRDMSMWFVRIWSMLLPRLFNLN